MQKAKLQRKSQKRVDFSPRILFDCRAGMAIIGGGVMRGAYTPMVRLTMYDSRSAAIGIENVWQGAACGGRTSEFFNQHLAGTCSRSQRAKDIIGGLAD